MKCNALMLAELKKTRLSGLALPFELASWVSSGFIQKDGCVFLSAQYKSHPGNAHFIDKTGLECFVNSFHIEDHVNERHLDYACLFCNEILGKWADEGHNEALRAIVSLNGAGVVVKFHIVRPGEHWLSADLDGYDDAVLEVDSEPGMPLSDFIKPAE